MCILKIITWLRVIFISFCMCGVTCASLPFFYWIVWFFFLIIGFLEPFYIFEISPLWCEIACMCCASIDIYVFQFVICPLAVTCSCSPHKMSWPNKMWTLILSALSLKSNVFELVLLPSWLRTYRWAQGRALQLRICRPQWTSSYRAAVSDPFVIFLGQRL